MPPKLRKYAPGAGPLSPAAIKKLQADFANVEDENRRELIFIGKWFRSLRVREGLTRQQCARRGGLHVSRVQLIEKIGSIKGAQNYARLWRALGLPEPELLPRLCRELSAYSERERERFERERKRFTDRIAA